MSNTFNLERACAALDAALERLEPGEAPALTEWADVKPSLRAPLARARAHLRACIRALFNGALRRSLELESEREAIDRAQGGTGTAIDVAAQLAATEAAHRPIPPEWRRASIVQRRADPRCQGCALAETTIQLVTSAAFTEISGGHLDKLLRAAWAAEKSTRELQDAWQEFAAPHKEAVRGRRAGGAAPSFDSDPVGLPVKLTEAIAALDAFQFGVSLYYPASAWIPRRGPGQPKVALRLGAVACLHQAGMGPAGIARALGITVEEVKTDRKASKQATPPPQKMRVLQRLSGVE